MNYLKEENALISRYLLQKMTSDILKHIKEVILKDLKETSFITIHINQAWKRTRPDLIVDAYFSHGKEKKKEDFIYKILSSEDISWRERVSLFEIYLILEEINKEEGNKSQASKNIGLSREAIRKKLIKTKSLFYKYKGGNCEEI